MFSLNDQDLLGVEVRSLTPGLACFDGSPHSGESKK
jgi:hypothetical protein